MRCASKFVPKERKKEIQLLGNPIASVKGEFEGRESVIEPWNMDSSVCQSHYRRSSNPDSTLSGIDIFGTSLDDDNQRYKLISGALSMLISNLMRYGNCKLRVNQVKNQNSAEYG